MLKPAINYVDQLNKLKSIIFDNEDKYKYCINADYIDYNFFCIEDSDYKSIQRVSVNSNDEVIGYMSANLGLNNVVTNLCLLNFYLDSKALPVSFARDTNAFIDYLFKYRKVTKIKFNVLIGNPAEKIYDRFVKNHNGRIVGTFKNDAILIDKTICDVKCYEIMRENYTEAKK